MLSPPTPSVVSLDQLSEDHVYLSYLNVSISMNVIYLNVSIDGDSVTALGNIAWCLNTLFRKAFFLISNQNWSSWLLHSLLVLSFIPEVDPRIVNVSPCLCDPITTGL